MDGTAAEVLAQQKDSWTQRKEVATRTKDFRKLGDSSKLAELKPLLKSYQSFIDLLTNHNKSSSSAFLDLYSSFSEVPDPFPLLEASIDSLVLAADTVPRMKAENGDLQRTVRNLTEQLEAAERRLTGDKERRIGEEKEQAGRIHQIESSWETIMKHKTEIWAAKERALDEKVENQDKLLADLKATFEVSQRLGEYDAERVQPGRSLAAQAEMEMMNAELERATMRLAEVETSNEALQKELTRSISTLGATRQTPDEDNPAFIRLQMENSSLMRKVENARMERESERRLVEVQDRSKQRQIDQLQDERTKMQMKLKSLADYNEIKRELDILRAIEFSTSDDVELLHTEENGSQSLEKLLLARNKKLSEDLTLLRVSNNESKSQLGSLLDELGSVSSDLAKSRTLCGTLENDLLHLQREYAISAAPTLQSSSAQQGNARAPNRRPGLARPASPTSSVSGTSAAIPTPTSRASNESLRTLSFSQIGAQGTGMPNANSLLPLLTSQRDRFRARNQELENELKVAQANVNSLRIEVTALQADNLRLFEKGRYVSSYSQSRSLSSTQPPPQVYSPPLDDYSSAPGILSANYKSSYDSTLNPFASFRHREGTRAYRRMRVPERIVYNMSKFLTSTRTSRNLFALYLFALHVLLLSMLLTGATTVAGLEAVVSAGGSVQRGDRMRGSTRQNQAGVIEDSKWLKEPGPA